MERDGEMDGDGECDTLATKVAKVSIKMLHITNLRNWLLSLTGIVAMETWVDASLFRWHAQLRLTDLPTDLIRSTDSHQRPSGTLRNNWASANAELTSGGRSPEHASPLQD